MKLDAPTEFILGFLLIVAAVIVACLPQWVQIIFASVMLAAMVIMGAVWIWQIEHDPAYKRMQKVCDDLNEVMRLSREIRKTLDKANKAFEKLKIKED